MRTLSISLVTLALVTMAAVAGRAQDTAHKGSAEQTLAGWHGFQALHFDLGGSSAPGPGESVPLSVVRITAAFSRIPDWSISWFDSEGFGKTTDYIAPGSNGFHPALSQSVQGVSLERRWSNRRAIHPLAGASTGTIRNSFDYTVYSAGSSEDHHDERRSTPFVAVNAGGELNVAHWLRLSISAGYRFASSYTWSTGSMRNSGAGVMTLLEFGKF